MDGIYDDLENYKDGEVIEELTNENKDLKFKINEYTMEIQKLQKDYDKLSTEHAKIQLNFSSLLKTAKAEIERKTQIIANLNMEKDLLVLSSIQNSNKDIFSLRRSLAHKKFNNRKQWNNVTDSIEASKKDVQDVKQQEPERPKNDENRVPSVDTVTSGNVSEDTSKNDNIDNKSSKLDSFDKSDEGKEIVAKGKKALSLKHRRKSMPVLNKIPASSDEEYEGDCSEELKKERLPREEISKKYFDRHKISETSGIDEKYSSYHESSRETYYKGKSHRSIEKLKNLRDKFRHRKHFSPEKIRRTTKEYQTDERQDIFRHNRVLMSPPRGGYESLRMLRDRRLNRESNRSYEERHSRRDDFYDDRLKRKDFRDNKYVQRDDYHMDRHKPRENRREEEKHMRKYEEIPRPHSRSDDRHGSDSLDERHSRKGDVVDEKLKSRDNSKKRTHKYGSQEKIPIPDSRSDERHRSDSLDERNRRKGDIVDEQLKSRENSEKRKSKYDSPDELTSCDPRSDDNHRSDSRDKRRRLKGDVTEEKLKSRENSEKHTLKYDYHDELPRNDSRSDDRHRSGSLDERQRLKDDVVDEKLKSRDNTEKSSRKYDSHEEIPRSDSRSEDRHRSDSLDARHRLKSDAFDEKLKSRDRFDKDSRKYDPTEAIQRPRSDVRYRSDSLDESHRLKGDTGDEKLKFSESSDKHLRKYDSHEETQINDIRSDSRPRDDLLDERYGLEGGVVDEKQKSRESPDKHSYKYDSHEETQTRNNYEEKLKQDIVDKTPISTDDNAKTKKKFEISKKRNRDGLLEELQKETLVQNNTRRRIRPIKISDLDEPSSKRARLGPFEKSVEVVKFPGEPVENRFENLEQNSCQSPDEPHHDTQRTPTVSICEQPKEIMTTSATALEDPRLSSKKYFKAIEGEKIVLSTITGRNVNLVSINVSTWDIPRVERPKALQEPPGYTVETVRDMYMDIDPVSNMSLESGEINSESSDVRMADYLSKNFYQDYENERINQIEARAEKAKHKRDSRVELDINLEPSIIKKVKQNEPQFPPVKHTVSRPSKPELITKSTPNPLGILLKQFQSVCSVDTTTKLTEAKLDVDATYGADNDSKDKNVIRKEDKPNEARHTVSTQELVEEDLALSDETSDNIFVRKQKKKVKVGDTTDDQKVLSDKNKSVKTVKKSTDKKPKKLKTSSKGTKQLKLKAKEKSDKTPEVPTEDQCVKKIKKKSVSKRPSSAKGSSKTVDIETITEKGTKSNKIKSPEDDGKDENKVKFTELFGSNSCSLITPEDLGVALLPESKIKKYVPIFEDAQDSVDVNVTATNKTEMVEQSVTSTKLEKPMVVEKTPKSLVCKISIPTIENIPKTAPTMEVSDVKVTKEVVVKTVVISTGVQATIQQPKTDTESADKTVKVDENAEEIVQDVHIPIALATSTPHKNLLLQLEANIECSRSCNSSEVHVSSVDRSSMSNGMSSEPHNDDDAPDVRIFMKRRRRVRK